MTAIIARHSLALSRRIFHVAPKTIRGKVLAHLSDVAERAGSREFDIPFDRQQLADYLGVDRSALSAELSRMYKAGLIETRRGHLVLKSKRLGSFPCLEVSPNDWGDSLFVP